MFTLTRPAEKRHLTALNHDYVEMDSIDLNDYFIPHKASQWIFKVNGTMMEPDVENGALVVVDALKKLSIGDIVIVAYQGELLIKRYVCENGKHKLISTSPEYKTLYIRDINLLEIWGVVVSKHVRV